MVSVVRFGCMVLAALWMVSNPGPAVASDIPAYDGPMDEGPTLHHYASRLCYLRGDIAYSVTDTGFDGAVAGAGGGCRIGQRGLRADVMLGWRGRLDVAMNTGLAADSGAATARSQFSNQTLMINVYYDLRQWYGLTAYVGAGIGLAHNRLADAALAPNTGGATRLRGGSSTDFAWSLMSGAAYRLAAHTTLDIGYRYIDLGNVEATTIDGAGNTITTATGDDVSAHEFKIGIRYNLPITVPWR